MWFELYLVSSCIKDADFHNSKNSVLKCKSIWMQQCVCIGCTCQIFVGCVYIGVNYMFVQCAHDVCLCMCVHIHVNLCVWGREWWIIQLEAYLWNIKWREFTRFLGGEWDLTKIAKPSILSMFLKMCCLVFCFFVLLCFVFQYSNSSLQSVPRRQENFALIPHVRICTLVRPDWFWAETIQQHSPTKILSTPRVRPQIHQRACDSFAQFLCILTMLGS